MVNEALMKIHVLFGPLAHFIFYKSLLLHSIGKNQSHSPSTCKECGGCEMWPVAGQGKHEHLVASSPFCQSSKDQISIWIFFYTIISHLFSQGFCCHSIHYKLPKCFPFSSSLPGLTPFFLPVKVCLIEGHLYIDLFLDFGLSLVGQACLSLFLTPLHECVSLFLTPLQS